MADNSTILLSSNDKGDETRVDLGVLEVILGIAARKVDGVSEMRGTLKTGIDTLFGRSNQGKGVSLSVEDDKLTAPNITAAPMFYTYLDYGVNVPKVCVQLQKNLTLQLKQMTDLDLTQINVHVVGLVSEADETEVKADTEALFPDDKEDEAKD